MRWLLLLLFPVLVLANTPQEYATLAGDPSSYIEGCVSAITGDLIIDQYDAVVQGAQPYPLRRRYISSDSSNPALPYKVLPHFYCRYYFIIDILKITEPNRLEITYELPKGWVHHTPFCYPSRNCKAW